MFAVPYYYEAQFRFVNLLYPTYEKYGEISHRGALPVAERYDTVEAVERRYNELLASGKLHWINNKSDQLKYYMGVCGWPYFVDDIRDFSTKMTSEVEHNIVDITVSFYIFFEQI